MTIFHTKNYLWSNNDIVGAGATSKVYKGFCKKTGDFVAVKYYLQNKFNKQPYLREFDIMRKLKHENIIKLLAIEDITQKSKKVLIMEFCSGGSLYEVLNEPRNRNGLEEEEFLQLLKDLYQALKYLRDNKVAHRDIKPANIMKVIKEDGSSIYKLTDFGASRVLEENEQFMSLCGTEEYLHPNVFERAILRKNQNQSFQSTIDLWSLGVTLYHAATGALPFQPYGGLRNNKRIMYEMISKKEFGHISGAQTSPNGPIQWSNKLPDSCRLSAGLKRIITPMLANLMHVDSKRSFDRFFTEVDKLLSRKCIHVFNVSGAELIRVYLSKQEEYAVFEENIREQTNITTENQLILYDMNAIYGEIQFETSENKPLYLFNKDKTREISIQNIELPSLESFPEVLDLEKDAYLAQIAYTTSCKCKQYIAKISLVCKLLCDSVKTFSKFLCKNLKKLYNTSTHLSAKYTLIVNKADSIWFTKKLIKYLSKNCEMSEDISKEHLKNLRTKIEHLHETECEYNHLFLKWEAIVCCLKCPQKTLATAKAETFENILFESWMKFERDRDTGKLTGGDEECHLFERNRISDVFYRMLHLLETEVQSQYVQFVRGFDEWFEAALQIYEEVVRLEKSLVEFEEILDEFDMKLCVSRCGLVDYVKSINRKQTFSETHKNDNSTKDVLQKVKMDIHNLLNNSRDIRTQLLEYC